MEQPAFFLGDRVVHDKCWAPPNMVAYYREMCPVRYGEPPQAVIEFRWDDGVISHHAVWPLDGLRRWSEDDLKPRAKAPQQARDVQPEDRLAVIERKLDEIMELLRSRQG